MATNQISASFPLFEADYSCQNPHPVIDAELPSLDGIFLASHPDLHIFAELPSPTLSLTNQDGNIGNILIYLGWPDINPLSCDIKMGGRMEITLPIVSIMGTILTGIKLSIDSSFDPFSMSGSISSELLGSLDLKFPGVTADINVISEIKTHISGSLPLLNYSGSQLITGQTGSLSIDLPALYYDSLVLQNGIIHLTIDLPCFLLHSSGSISSGIFSFKTIVMNTQHFGVTEYGNISLKGMTDVFGKTIAISGSRIISMGNALDDTEHINASFRTGTLDFSNPYFVKPRDIWLNMRSGKQIMLTIKDNEYTPSENIYESELFEQDLHKTRVKVGRGYFSDFFDIQVDNIDGELIDITSIHFYSDVVPGRKR
jgi:hypothetical protein